MEKYKNYLLPAFLIILAIFVLKFPAIFFLSTDISAAASLSGALIAAAAIFVGNQININATNEIKAKEIEEEKESIRYILMSEMVPIFIRHVREAKQYIDLCQLISRGDQTTLSWSTYYQILKPNIYYSLTKELIKLPVREADALVTLYSQMGDTQKSLDDLFQSNVGTISYLTAQKLANQLSADCRAAAKVVQFIAPLREIKLISGKTINFVDLLNNPEKFN